MVFFYFFNLIFKYFKNIYSNFKKIIQNILKLFNFLKFILVVEVTNTKRPKINTTQTSLFLWVLESLFHTREQ
jgi:hypothetical protein